MRYVEILSERVIVNPFHAGPANCNRCGTPVPKWQTWAIGTQQPPVKCEKCKKRQISGKIVKNSEKLRNLAIIWTRKSK